MIGCVAKATSDELHVDKTEMDEVRWIHRDRVLQVVQASSNSDNPLLGAAHDSKYSKHLVSKRVYTQERLLIPHRQYRMHSNYCIIADTDVQLLTALAGMADSIK